MNTNTVSKRELNRAAFASLIGIATLCLPALCRAQGSPSIGANGIITASAFGGYHAAAPGSLIEIYGSNLAANTLGWGSAFNGVNAPTSLDGTSVTIGGEDAFVAYVSPAQVNVQVPSSVGTGPQPVIVKTSSGVSSPYTVTVNATEPGLLAPTSFAIGGKQYVAAFFSDGVTLALPPGAIPGVPSRRAKPGDPLTLYGVGFGQVIPNIPAGQIVQEDNMLAASFQLEFGTTPATITYAGLAPDETGVYQFDVTVPSIASSDTVSVTFTLGGVSGTQTVYISVQNGNTAAQVQNLTLAAISVAAGGTLQGTIVLSEPAPAGGAIVALSSNSSAATVPSTVTVPAAATSANFTVSAGSVSSNQTVTITATYGGSSAQATLTVTQAAAAAFVSLLSNVTFQPVGYPSLQLFFNVTPNAGNMTYTAIIDGNSPSLTLLNGTVSGQTITFDTLQPALNPSAVVLFGTIVLNQLSAASLTFTLNQTLAVPGTAEGSLTGTFSVTGTPFGSSAPVTLSGAIAGTYTATLPAQ